MNIFSRLCKKNRPIPQTSIDLVKNISSLVKKNGGLPSQPLSRKSERLNRTACIEPSQFLNFFEDQFLKGCMVSGTMTPEPTGRRTSSMSPVPTDPQL